MKICLKCKTQVEDCMNFCPNCGSNDFCNPIIEGEQPILNNIPTTAETKAKNRKKAITFLAVVLAIGIALTALTRIFPGDGNAALTDGNFGTEENEVLTDAEKTKTDIQPEDISVSDSATFVWEIV